MSATVTVWNEWNFKKRQHAYEERRRLLQYWPNLLYFIYSKLAQYLYIIILYI